MSGERGAAEPRHEPGKPRRHDVPADVKLIQPRGSAA
jgi:hypothetical protein